jgi:putative flippase GtrA
VVMLAAMWFLTELVHLHYLISKIVSSVLVFAVNFTMRKLLLFRSQRP